MHYSALLLAYAGIAMAQCYAGQTCNDNNGNHFLNFGTTPIFTMLASSTSSSEPLNTAAAVVTKEERCGNGHGGHRCSNGACCSGAGFCGTGRDYCSVPTNCQTAYGICDSDSVPKGPSTGNDQRKGAIKRVHKHTVSRCKQPNTIALTFDDGPSNNTHQLLDILKQAKAKATFFIGANNNGKGQIDTTPEWSEVIQRMDDEGHQIAVHGWSHIDMDAASSEARITEIHKTERALANILGKYPTFMRAPYVKCSRSTGCIQDMKSLGYTVISWHIDSTDWEHEFDLEAMKTAVDAAFNSDINNMLLIQHDTLPVSALQLTPHVLEQVANKHWKAVTVAECLGEPLEYQYPDNFEGTTASRKRSCAYSDNSTGGCYSLQPFNDRFGCFRSQQACLHDLKAWRAPGYGFERVRAVCDRQFLFCAQCGHGKGISVGECNEKDFKFGDW